MEKADLHGAELQPAFPAPAVGRACHSHRPPAPPSGLSPLHVHALLALPLTHSAAYTPALQQVYMIAADMGTDMGTDTGTNIGTDMGTAMGTDMGTNMGTDIDTPAYGLGLFLSQGSCGDCLTA